MAITHTAHMFRWIATLLSFVLVVGSMDTAMHVAALTGVGGAHELHALVHAPGEASANPDALDPAAQEGGESSAHYCHCAAHSPAMPTSFALSLRVLTQQAVPVVLQGHGNRLHCELLRPPIQA